MPFGERIVILLAGNMGIKNQILLFVALSNLRDNPTLAMLTLLKLNKLDPRLLIPYVDAVVEGLRVALDPNVCRRVQILLKDLWMKLNTMIPRR
jgi:hypothetical protein